MQVDLFVFDRAPQSFDEHVGVSSQLRRLATIRADVLSVGADRTHLAACRVSYRAKSENLLADPLLKMR